MPQTAIAEFEDITKEYRCRWLGRGATRAVLGVSLHLEPAEVFGLIGPNRAGKTTLVKILLSLCRSTSGHTTRFGRSVSDRNTLARVGYVHENPSFPRYLTALGLLEYYGALAFVPRAQINKRAMALLDRVGLADRCHEPIARFSKGMIQRLAIAQSLINNPDLWILDEPSEGLDLEGRHVVGELICAQRRSGKAVLLVSHVLAEVEQFCDRIAVMVGGPLAHTGPLAALTRQYTSGVRSSLDQALQELYGRPVQ
jgi:ABC-2 type transport system ATP-binding protein